MQPGRRWRARTRQAVVVAARQKHGIWWGQGRGQGRLGGDHRASQARGHLHRQGQRVDARHKNLVPGESVYGEKRISTDAGGEDDAEVEYRVWNPFRSKLAAGVLGGMDKILIAPGPKVLYICAAGRTT